MSGWNRRCRARVSALCFVVIAAVGEYAQAGDAGGAAPAAGTSMALQFGLFSTSPRTPGGWNKGAQAFLGVDWLQGEIASFEAARPDIRVMFTELQKTPFQREVFRPDHQKMFEEELVPVARNVIGFQSWDPDLASLLKADLIVPIDQFLPDPDFRPEDYYDNLWNSVTIGGKRWGVPWASDTLFLVCNMKMFRAAGIAAPPATWDEFVDDAKKMTDTAAASVLDRKYGFVPYVGGSSMGLLMFSMVLQKDGQIWTEQGFQLNEATWREAFDIWKRMELAVGPAVLQDPDHTNLNIIQMEDLGRLYRAENCGMFLATADSLNTLPNSPDFQLAPIPTFGRPAYFSSGRFYLAIRKSTPEEEKASWELVKWLTRHDVSLPKVWGGYPCRKDFIERADFKAKTERGTQNLSLIYECMASSTAPGPLVESSTHDLRLALMKGMRMFHLNFVKDPSISFSMEDFQTTLKDCNALFKLYQPETKTPEYGLFK